mgnify:FL=1|jgi:hypothetical protein
MSLRFRGTPETAVYLGVCLTVVSLQSVIADLSYCWLSDFYG